MPHVKCYLLLTKCKFKLSICNCKRRIPLEKKLIHGPITKSILLFSAPIILGNLLQQLYNVVDTLIVGRFLGADALAAVGSSFTLMVFLTSVILGLCMGSGISFSILYGAGNTQRLHACFLLSFIMIGLITILINLPALLLLDPIMTLLHIPVSIRPETRSYLQVILYGLFFTFLYNYFSSLLRALGNSLVPLLFLALSALMNIALDLLFVISFGMGIAGAAWATIISQAFSALLLAVYTIRRLSLHRIRPKTLHFDRLLLKELLQYSLLTSVQQSVMNFGILIVQGLVNSFGVTVMAAFAAAVKIDSFAYMPVQDFGNGFSTFIAQNLGAGKTDRIQKGIRSAFLCSFLFCLFISAVVLLFAERLMLIFIRPEELEIIAIGAGYLRIEGACYFAIGFLFLFYGLYRGLGRPGISVVLTVISLGTRVLLSYMLAPIPAFGTAAIWWSIPIGWFLADAAGVLFFFFNMKKIIKIQ